MRSAPQAWLGRRLRPTGTGKWAGAAAALVLVCVFTAVVVSVVNARRPLDGWVSESFDAVVSKQAPTGWTVKALGCRKERPYYYACAASAQPRRGAASAIRWRLVLQDDGCWTATRRAPFPRDPAVRSRLGPLKGCTRT